MSGFRPKYVAYEVYVIADGSLCNLQPSKFSGEMKGMVHNKRRVEIS